jgi:hypothetical protein
VPEGLEDRVLLSGPTVYTVTDASGSASDTGSLPYAVLEANGTQNPAGSLIQFDPTFFNGATLRTITLASTLTLSETGGPEVIDGPDEVGRYDPDEPAFVISGNAAVQVFKVDSNATTAVLTDLAIVQGSSAQNGGGIDNEGMLTLSDCIIGGNSAASGNGGGINNDGNLTVTDCTIEGNSAAGDGGGIANTNMMIVSDSALLGNSSGVGGGIYSAGTVQVTDSTIADNSATFGGGLVNYLRLMTVVNATVVYNTASQPGQSGGLITSAGPVTLDNTIVAQNTAAGAAGNILVINGGSVSPSSGYNLIGTGGSGGLINGDNGNEVGITDPGLAPQPTATGGLTSTIALEPGSPAIDAGSNALDARQTTDQRGPGFVRVYNGTVDIGAYELQPATVADVFVDWGTQTTQVYAAADGIRLLPAGRHTDLPWLGIDVVEFTLNEPATLTAAEVSVTSVRGINYGPVTVGGPVTILGSGMTNVYFIKFARPIEKADRVTITIAGAGLSSFSGRLDVLPGDFDDNGVVNDKDVTAIRNEWKGKKGAQPTIFGEIVGDGTVNGSDYNAARSRVGTKLPKLGGKTPKATLARALVRQHPGVKYHG